MLEKKINAKWFLLLWSVLTYWVYMHYIFTIDDTFLVAKNLQETLIASIIHIDFLWSDLNQCIMEWKYSELIKAKCIVMAGNSFSDNSRLVCSRNYFKPVVKWLQMNHAPRRTCCFALWFCGDLEPRVLSNCNFRVHHLQLDCWTLGLVRFSLLSSFYGCYERVL